MAKQNTEANPEVGFDNIEQNLGKAEQFIENNSRVLVYSFLGLILLILAGFGVNKYILEPKEKDAFDAIFHAENYFKQDSLSKALNGDGINPGFLQVIDDYGSTKSGNLAHYYTGIIYLKMGQNDTTSMANDHFENAIKHLKKFSADDDMISVLATGRMGDAEMELGNMDKAASLYDKAGHMSENGFSAPEFLKRAGMTYSILGNHSKALEMYKEIKKDYYQSFEASDIDKYIALEEAQL
jgi:tetratricopeptide (TPR) repeat protein